MQSLSSGGLRLSNSLARETPARGIYALVNPQSKDLLGFVSEDFHFLKDRSGWMEFRGSTFSPPLPKDRQAALDRELIISRINLDSAIVYKFGDGRRKIAVVDAIDCGHCRDFEARLRSTKKQFNATIYIFPASLGRDAASIAAVRGIWCAEQPAAQWRSVMATQGVPKVVSAEHCDERRTVEFSDDLRALMHAHGTPAFIDLQPADGFSELSGSLVFSGFPAASKPQWQDATLDMLLNKKLDQVKQ